MLTGSERVVQDGVALGLRAGSAAEFDALIVRGRELALQPQDIVELIEMKGLAALRAGRRPTASGCSRRRWPRRSRTPS